jgi:hypothetical protein
MSEQQQQQAPEGSTVGENPPAVQPLKGDESDAEVARKLSVIIDSALQRIQPILELMKQATILPSSPPPSHG